VAPGVTGMVPFGHTVPFTIIFGDLRAAR
jgi:hypothetical protein